MGLDPDGLPWIIGASMIFTSYQDGDVLGIGKYPRNRRRYGSTAREN